jgi:ubiquinone/menaquinone biosynthesis C-methylase UbiE
MTHRTPRLALLRLALGVALVLGLAGADCATRAKIAGYEGDDRETWQQTGRVVETLGLEPGDVVADVGSGSGWFTLPLARAVAPDGRVYAVDVDPEMNAYLEERLAEEGVENVTVVLATPDDPGLPEGTVDLVFTSNTYHHLPNQRRYFASLRPYLAPGGRVAVVEYEPAKAGWFARTFGHATPKRDIVASIVAGGYRLAHDHDFLERQAFLVFEPSTDRP